MKEPALSTIKQLFARSRNRCAFPGCQSPIVEDSGVVTGKVCHIKARSPGGPRYDAAQSDEERHAFANLILLCGRHHDVVDAQHELYSADTLIEMKLLHETGGPIELKPQDGVFARVLLNDYRQFTISNNTGTIIIDSPGAIQGENVTVKTQTKRVNILPPKGAIASDLRMRGYAKYLIDRYNKFASSDQTRKTRFSHGALYKNINDRFGVKWDLVPKQRFSELVEYLQSRIGRTKQARINKGKGWASYRSYSDYCRNKLCEEAEP